MSSANTTFGSLPHRKPCQQFTLGFVRATKGIHWKNDTLWAVVITTGASWAFARLLLTHRLTHRRSMAPVFESAPNGPTAPELGILGTSRGAFFFTFTR